MVEVNPFVYSIIPNFNIRHRLFVTSIVTLSPFANSLFGGFFQSFFFAHLNHYSEMDL